MAGGRKGFLDEQTGDFVKYLRGVSAVSNLVGAGNDARIYSDAARQGAERPHVVYTQVGGSSEKDLGGLVDCEDVNLHVYAYADSPTQAKALAWAVHDRMLPTQAIIGDGTKLMVCNGGIIDSGHEDAKDSSDRKKYWVRLILRMVVSD